MISTRESAIEKKCTAIAKANGWLPFKFTSPAQRGVPDRLYIRAGAVVFVEYKRHGEHPTPLQAKIHRDMRGHGAVIHVIDNEEQAHAVFE